MAKGGIPTGEIFDFEVGEFGASWQVNQQVQTPGSIRDWYEQYRPGLLGDVKKGELQLAASHPNAFHVMVFREKTTNFKLVTDCHFLNLTVPSMENMEACLGRWVSEDATDFYVEKIRVD